MRSGVGALMGALLVLVLGSTPGPAPGAEGSASDLESYAAVKRALYGQVFAGQRATLYCACRFDGRRRLDPASCGYDARGGGERARRIEVEHVVPASWIGQGRPCWHDKICRDAGGRAFKGRKCCLAVDPAFREAYQDMHNLWPTVGAVNGRRSNYRFGLIEGERRAFGRCDFEVDAKTRRAEPRPEIRGDVARASLHMEAEHGVRLSDAQRKLFEAWHRQDPPDAAERSRHDRVVRLQRRVNRWIVRPATM